MLKVFISHSSLDHDFIDTTILPILEEAGVNIWYSKESITAASQWEESILKGLKECEWFMIILSHNAMQSDWVKDELFWAIANRPDRIVPIIRDATINIAEFHIRLARIQAIDFSTEVDVARSRLLSIWRNSLPNPVVTPEEVEAAQAQIAEQINSSVPPITSDAIVNILASTITYGAVYYNKGFPRSCAELYAAVAQGLLERLRTVPLSSAASAGSQEKTIKQIVETELSFVKPTPPVITDSSAAEIAWTYRHAFDHLKPLHEVDAQISTLEDTIQEWSESGETIVPWDLHDGIFNLAFIGSDLNRERAYVASAHLLQFAAKRLLAFFDTDLGKEITTRDWIIDGLGHEHVSAPITLENAQEISSSLTRVLMSIGM
jgi:hypothetical protein